MGLDVSPTFKLTVNKGSEFSIVEWKEIVSVTEFSIIGLKEIVSLQHT